MYDLMLQSKKWMLLCSLCLVLMACGAQSGQEIKDSMSNNVEKTDSQWRAELTAEEYRVLRMKGTEKPFSGEYETHWDSGTYVCKGCDAELFNSATKFDAHCGWPSFYESVDKSAVKEIIDRSHGMLRTEVVCAACGGHLGHVFNDGFEQPTGMRYCINSVSLGFKKKGDAPVVPKP